MLCPKRGDQQSVFTHLALFSPSVLQKALLPSRGAREIMWAALAAEHSASDIDALRSAFEDESRAGAVGALSRALQDFEDDETAVFPVEAVRRACEGGGRIGLGLARASVLAAVELVTGAWRNGVDWGETVEEAGRLIGSVSEGGDEGMVDDGCEDDEEGEQRDVDALRYKGKVLVRLLVNIEKKAGGSRRDKWTKAMALVSKHREENNAGVIAIDLLRSAEMMRAQARSRSHIVALRSKGGVLKSSISTRNELQEAGCDDASNVLSKRTLNAIVAVTDDSDEESLDVLDEEIMILDSDDEEGDLAEDVSVYTGGGNCGTEDGDDGEGVLAYDSDGQKEQKSDFCYSDGDDGDYEEIGETTPPCPPTPPHCVLSDVPLRVGALPFATGSAGNRAKAIGVVARRPHKLSSSTQARKAGESYDFGKGLRYRVLGKRPREDTHVRWDILEDEKLIAGIKKYGMGEWGLIRKNEVWDPPRTSIQLKDRTRTAAFQKMAPHFGPPTSAGVSRPGPPAKASRDRLPASKKGATHASSSSKH